MFITGQIGMAAQQKGSDPETGLFGKATQGSIGVLSSWPEDMGKDALTADVNAPLANLFGAILADLSGSETEENQNISLEDIEAVLRDIEDELGISLVPDDLSREIQADGTSEQKESLKTTLLSLISSISQIISRTVHDRPVQSIPQQRATGITPKADRSQQESVTEFTPQQREKLTGLNRKIKELLARAGVSPESFTADQLKGDSLLKQEHPGPLLQPRKDTKSASSTQSSPLRSMKDLISLLQEAGAEVEKIIEKIEKNPHRSAEVLAFFKGLKEQGDAKSASSPKSSESNTAASGSLTTEVAAQKSENAGTSREGEEGDTRDRTDSQNSKTEKKGASLSLLRPGGQSPSAGDELFRDTLSADQSHVTETDAVSGKSSTAKSDPVYKGLQQRLFEMNILNQINNRLSDAVKSGSHEIRLKLKPDHLGDVQVRIQVEKDVVTAKINVENQQVRQIVESNFQSLRDALADHDLSAGSLDVNVGGFSDDREDKNSSGSNQGGGQRFTDEEETVATDDERGVDTGRRFGNNSFEYQV
ncbi:MAG: flagellar hook-length control protein FliK [Fibrobacterota bacterium]